MTPKQFIKYTQMIDKRGFAICDGMSEPLHMSLFDILYPIFLISGFISFVTVLMFWEEIKKKIFGR